MQFFNNFEGYVKELNTCVKCASGGDVSNITNTELNDAESVIIKCISLTLFSNTGKCLWFECLV